MSTYTRVTNFQKQSGFLAHPVFYKQETLLLGLQNLLLQPALQCTAQRQQKAANTSLLESRSLLQTATLVFARPIVCSRFSNKSAQSNLGRGPRRCKSLHVRRKVPIGYNKASQIRLQKYPFPWTDLQTPLPASSL